MKKNNKKLNPLIKIMIEKILKDNDVFIKRSPGSDDYIVNDPKKPSLKITNAWDYGLYSISLNGNKIMDIEWRENNDLSQSDLAMKDFSEILKVAQAAVNDTEMRKVIQQEMTNKEKTAVGTLSPQELEIYKSLKGLVK